MGAYSRSALCRIKSCVLVKEKLWLSILNMFVKDAILRNQMISGHLQRYFVFKRNPSKVRIASGITKYIMAAQAWFFARRPRK